MKIHEFSRRFSNWATRDRSEALKKLAKVKEDGIDAVAVLINNLGFKVMLRSSYECIKDIGDIELIA